MIENHQNSESFSEKELDLAYERMWTDEEYLQEMVDNASDVVFEVKEALIYSKF